MTGIQMFSSEASAFLVNSFLLETRQGLVLIDTQFMSSTALQLIEVIRAHRKPLMAVIVTHPHPDHFNGTHAIRAAFPGVPILATEATREVIRATAEDKRQAWTPVYGEDYPQQVTLPDVVIEPGRPLVIDGLELQIDDLGAGESADITVVHVPQANALIASDLVYHHVHPWLAEGRTYEWLKQIDSVRERYPAVATLYPGHGPVADGDALLLQAEYLTTFRALVLDEVADLALPTAEEKYHIAQRTRQRYPGYPLEMLIERNVDGVAREFAKDLTSAA